MISAALQGLRRAAWPPARRGAIKARHFTDEQIFAQIEGVLA